jgi:hypothetical protein
MRRRCDLRDLTYITTVSDFAVTHERTGIT